MCIRDRFNTTIYNENDTFRGIHGGRRVLLINAADIARLGLKEGDLVDASAVTGDGIARSVSGLRLVGYDVPAGCVAGYFPECNPLMALEHHAVQSMVPAAKSIAIRIGPAQAAG